LMSLTISLLGEPALTRGNQSAQLPRSRKTRALLVYLTLAEKPQRREALCNLLWSATNDPRASLRWSLAKLRALLGDALMCEGETVAVSFSPHNCDIYALKAQLKNNSGGCHDELSVLEACMGPDYLPGIDCNAGPEFELWLESQREIIRQLHRELLERLHKHGFSDPSQAISFSRKRVGLDYFATEPNLALLRQLLAHEGLQSAQKAMQAWRDRLHKAHIDTTEAERQWHRLTHKAPLPAPDIERGTILELPSCPSLAVLTFHDIGKNPHGILAEGFTSDLISRLSRLRELFVIARASSSRFSPLQFPVANIGQHLGVRYLVHGTTQSYNGRIKVNVVLVEAATSREIWSDCFESPLDDLFLIQDEIANTVTSSIEPEIERAEFERARLKNPENLDAWENYHMALWHSFKFTCADTDTAELYLKRALIQDPDFNRIYAAMSLNHFSRAFLNTTPDPSENIELALEHAQHSLQLDSRDAMGHWSLGRALFLNNQHDLALVSADRSLQANANYAQGHYARGFIGVHCGLPVDASPNLATAQRLSPFDPLLFAMKSSQALSFMMQGQFELAASWAVNATIEPNAHYHIYAVAGACLQLAGRYSEAKRNIAIACKRHPGYTRKKFFESFPYKMRNDQQLISKALADAGLV
jgi:TolB-like protein/DNA-binding SARP family transcriptional activator